jgi:hypothetical protein
MKTKLLLGLGLFSISFLAYADQGVHYALTNTSTFNIPSPIRVTGGYLEYQFSGLYLPLHCPVTPVRVDLSMVTNQPLLLEVGTPNRFTFTFPPSVEDCFGVYGGSDKYPLSGATVHLHITEVDGVKKQDGDCDISPEGTGVVKDTYPFLNAQISKTTDGGFNCSMTMLMSSEKK